MLCVSVLVAYAYTMYPSLTAPSSLSQMGYFSCWMSATASFEMKQLSTSCEPVVHLGTYVFCMSCVCVCVCVCMCVCVLKIACELILF